MPSADNFCKQLDLDQTRQNVGSDQAANCLKLVVFLKEFFNKGDFEKNQQMTKSMQNYPMVQIMTARVETLS